MKSFERYFLAAAMVVAISGLAVNTQARAQQSNNGAAIENTYGQTGNSATGGNNATGGTITYQTAPSSDATSGYANIAGAGVSNAHVSGVDTIADSKSSLAFGVGAVGLQPEITIDAFVGQSNGATAPTTANGYADGANGTGATIKGSATGDPTQCVPVAGSGTANANGMTLASTTTTANGLGATSAAATTGNSNAAAALTGGVSPQFTTGITGAGGIEAGALVLGQNGSGAEGNFAANMQYGATNSSDSSTGSLGAHGTTTVSVSPTGNAASASTTVSSQAAAH